MAGGGTERARGRCAGGRRCEQAGGGFAVREREQRTGAQLRRRRRRRRDSGGEGQRQSGRAVASEHGVSDNARAAATATQQQIRRGALSGQEALRRVRLAQLGWRYVVAWREPWTTRSKRTLGPRIALCWRSALIVPDGAQTSRRAPSLDLRRARRRLDSGRAVVWAVGGRCRPRERDYGRWQRGHRHRHRHRHGHGHAARERSIQSISLAGPSPPLSRRASAG